MFVDNTVFMTFGHSKLGRQQKCNYYLGILSPPNRPFLRHCAPIKNFFSFTAPFGNHWSNVTPMEHYNFMTSHWSCHETVYDIYITLLCSRYTKTTYIWNWSFKNQYRTLITTELRIGADITKVCRSVLYAMPLRGAAARLIWSKRLTEQAWPVKG